MMSQHAYFSVVQEDGFSFYPCKVQNEEIKFLTTTFSYTKKEDGIIFSSTKHNINECSLKYNTGSKKYDMKVMITGQHVHLKLINLDLDGTESHTESKESYLDYNFQTHNATLKRLVVSVWHENGDVAIDVYCENFTSNIEIVQEKLRIFIENKKSFDLELKYVCSENGEIKIDCSQVQTEEEFKQKLNQLKKLNALKANDEGSLKKENNVDPFIQADHEGSLLPKEQQASDTSKSNSKYVWIFVAFCFFIVILVIYFYINWENLWQSNSFAIEMKESSVMIS